MTVKHWKWDSTNSVWKGLLSVISPAHQVSSITLRNRSPEKTKKNSETTNHLTLFQSLLIVRQAGSKKRVYLKLTTSTGRVEWKFQKHGYPITGDQCRGKQLTATARIKKRISKQLKTNHSQRSIVQSTPALRTPSYNGHPNNTDNS